MVIQEENDFLTRTGRGTPCGELMRRYWQPAALSEELGSAKPLAVQLFGEELVLFRDGEGHPAMIGRYCAHQGVDMIYGRIEQDGIRCMYHGWLFDACGKVIVRGGWVEGGEKRMAVGQPAYPCVEMGGAIFVYMGPDAAPALPMGKLFVNSPPRLTLMKALQNENYLRGILGGNEALPNGAKFVMPNLVTYHGMPLGAESWVRWHVPVDDNCHEEFTVRFFGEIPFTGDPSYAAPQILVKAIDDIRIQLRVSSGAATKSA